MDMQTREQMLLGMDSVRTVAGQQGALDAAADVLYRRGLCAGDGSHIKIASEAIRAYQTHLAPSQVAPANPAQVMDKRSAWLAEAKYDALIEEAKDFSERMTSQPWACELIERLLDALTAAIGAGGQAVADEDALETVERELIDGLEVEINIGAENYTFNHRQLARRILSALSRPAPLMDEVEAVLKPFAALADAVFYVDEDGREMNATKPDDQPVWGFDRVELTFGHLRAARALIAKLQEGGR